MAKVAFAVGHRGEDTIGVLVTSAGAASAVNVIKALRVQKELPVRIVAVDVDRTAAGLYLADAAATVPRSDEEQFVPALFELCAHHRIRALYPIHSREIGRIARRQRDFFERKIGVLVPPAEVVALCDDKRRMYEAAAAAGLATPRPAAPSGPVSLPLFAKPNTASGTSRAFQIPDKVTWSFARSRFPDLLFQEFVGGEEYTVDLLCDRQSRVLVASPRLRLSTKAGQSVKGRTVEEPELVALCTHLCQTVGMVGPCNMQFIRRDGKFVFIEINPRYAAGGLMLTVHAGANVPLLALRLMLGADHLERAWVRPNVQMIRYWEEIILPWDRQS